MKYQLRDEEFFALRFVFSVTYDKKGSTLPPFARKRLNYQLEELQAAHRSNTATMIVHLVDSERETIDEITPFLDYLIEMAEKNKNLIVLQFLEDFIRLNFVFRDDRKKNGALNG